MPDCLLSPEGLATILDVSKKWMYQQLNAGNIPGANKIGGLWFIDYDVFQSSFKTAKPKAQKGKAVKSIDKHGLA